MMRPALALLAAAVLVIAGCGSTASPSASPSPTPSRVAFTVPTKTFSSPAMGVAFRYPASWRWKDIGDPATSGNFFVVFSDPALRAGQPLLLLHVSVRLPALAAQQSITPFKDAGPGDLQQARVSTLGAHVLRGGFVRLDGLRLAEVEYRANGRSLLTRPRAHRLALVSGKPIVPPGVSTVEINVGGPPVVWQRERSAFAAILASLRFTTPEGPK
jgi:hypothetical protein